MSKRPLQPVRSAPSRSTAAKSHKGGRPKSKRSEPSSDSDLRQLMELLAVPGPSGKEAAISERIQTSLRQAGVPSSRIFQDQAHRRSPLRGEVGNLVVRLPGTVRGSRRLLMAHLDTVPICVGSRPVRRGHFIHSADKQTGLGADNRAGCAVILQTAVSLLKQALPHPPLTFVWTVQEEIGLQGARLLNLGALGKPRYAFNWDGGSASKLTVGATGGYRMQIDVFGKASHAGGAPEHGVSAIAAAGLAISQLHQDGWHGAIQKKGRVGTSNIGVVQGGSATNVVADHVMLLAEARSHNAEFRQQIVQRITTAFQQAAKNVRNERGETARVEIQGRIDYEAFCLPTDDPCIQAAERAVKKIGREPELAVANGGLDANWLTARGIPTVSLGCGQLGQHTVDESLDTREFRAACRIALELATKT